MIGCFSLVNSGEAANIDLELLGSWPGGARDEGSANFVSVVDDFAYLVDDEDTVQVLDIRDPSNPVKVAQYDGGECWSGVAVYENYLYLAASDDSSSTILDIIEAAGGVEVLGHFLSDLREVWEEAWDGNIFFGVDF